MPHSVDQRRPRGQPRLKGWTRDSLSVGGAADILATASLTKWRTSAVCITQGDGGLMLTLILDWLSEPYSDNFKNYGFMISDGSHCSYSPF